MTEREEQDDGVEIVVDDDRTARFLLHGVLHRDGGPAIMRPGPSGHYDEVWWYRFGKIHREDGPAIELADGSKKWFCDGKPHREDGPAVERADGSKEYWLDGEFLDGGASELARRRPPALLRVIEKARGMKTKPPFKPG